MMDVDQCKLFSLPKFNDERGSLSFVEGNVQIPFAIERLYYLYDIPSNAARGAHAHKELHQLMIAMSGRFDVILDDGSRQERVTLSSPDQGLYICPMIWRDLENFEPGSVCAVLASARYEEADYYRNYEEFQANRKQL